jgi:hypothetical protein
MYCVAERAFHIKFIISHIEDWKNHALKYVCDSTFCFALLILIFRDYLAQHPKLGSTVCQFKYMNQTANLMLMSEKDMFSDSQVRWISHCISESIFSNASRPVKQFVLIWRTVSCTISSPTSSRQSCRISLSIRACWKLSWPDQGHKSSQTWKSYLLIPIYNATTMILYYVLLQNWRWYYDRMLVVNLWLLPY